MSSAPHIPGPRRGGRRPARVRKTALHAAYTLCNDKFSTNNNLFLYFYFAFQKKAIYLRTFMLDSLIKSACVWVFK
jgi:hypothetical protein